MGNQQKNEGLCRGLARLAAICNFFKKKYSDLDKYLNEEFSVIKLAKQTTSTVVVLVVFYAALQIIVGLRHRFIVIEPFEVSTVLSENGYSGKAVANMISAEIYNIMANSDFIIQNMVITSGSTTAPDIVIPGSSNTLKSVIMNIREFIKEPTFVATGAITKHNDKLKIFIMLNGLKKLKIKDEFAIISDSENDVYNMISTAAERIYGQIDPVTLASYYHNKAKFDQAIELCNIMPIDNNNAHLIYLIWADSLFLQHKYQDAVKIIKLATTVKASPIEAFYIHIVWGKSLRKMNRFKEAQIQFEKALSYNENDTSTLITIGDVLLMQGKYSEASEYVRKAIESIGNDAKQESTSRALMDVLNNLTSHSVPELDTERQKMNDALMSLIR